MPHTGIMYTPGKMLSAPSLRKEQSSTMPVYPPRCRLRFNKDTALPFELPIKSREEDTVRRIQGSWSW